MACISSRSCPCLILVFQAVLQGFQVGQAQAVHCLQNQGIPIAGNKEPMNCLDQFQTLTDPGVHVSGFQRNVQVSLSTKGDSLFNHRITQQHACFQYIIGDVSVNSF